MSASTIVYRKTAAGLAEMQARRLSLPRKTFSLLLAVDGQRSRAQLCSTLSAFGDVATQLELLEEMGLIEDSDARAGGAFSFAAPLNRRRDESAGTPFEPNRPGPAGAGFQDNDPLGDDRRPSGEQPWSLPTGIHAGGTPSGHSAMPSAGAGSDAASSRADEPGFDTDSTTTWAVTELGPPTTILAPMTLPGEPDHGAGGFVELDTWPGTDVRGGSAPTWPKSAGDGSFAGSPPGPGAAGVQGQPCLADLPPLGPLPEHQLPQQYQHLPQHQPPLQHQPRPQHQPSQNHTPQQQHTAQQPPAPQANHGPAMAAGPGAAAGPAHPGRLPPLAASLQDARRPGGFNADGASGQPRASPAQPIAPATGPAQGSGPSNGSGPSHGSGHSQGISLPSVSPLPPWSMPPAPRQATPADPQYPLPIDRSLTYPAEYNLIDIRAYIGVGSQRVDPLANVREAMAHVIARNIDLQNYELLHAIESMQSRDDLLRLLPYYLVDLDRRLAPADYRLHVENLSRLSGLTTDALLTLMTQRKGSQPAG